MTSQAPTAAAVAGNPNSWGWALASGILLVVAGVFALAAPGAATVAFAIFFGWLLLIAGVAGIVMGIRTRSAHERWLDLLYGVASLVLGAVMLIHPIAGALSLTLAFAIFLAFRGAVEIGGALRAGRGQLRTMLIVAGVVNLLLAVLLLTGFPYPAVQAIGLFVGISFLIGGIATIAAAIQLRRLANG